MTPWAESPVARRGQTRPQLRGSRRAAVDTALPTGTVTFLFTNIEGSTRLVNELGDRYDALLAAHHELIRAALAREGGIEVSTEGDSFFAAPHAFVPCLPIRSWTSSSTPLPTASFMP